MKTIVFLLFENYESLDVFGPVEIFGRIPSFTLIFASMKGGLITNSQGAQVQTEKLDTLKEIDVLLIPGGKGTRLLVAAPLFIDALKNAALKARYLLTVCTGSALLAKTGLLDGHKATSNKRAFDWVTTTSNNVDWQKKARWTVSDHIYTSSGVSAGMDMSLGFLADNYGMDFALDIANGIEYIWQADKESDPFSF